MQKSRRTGDVTRSHSIPSRKHNMRADTAHTIKSDLNGFGTAQVDLIESVEGRAFGSLILSDSRVASAPRHRSESL